MPSKLRIQFEGARYHVINRGNYRSDVFAAKGAPEAFVRTLFEAARRYGWKVHAYVLMQNHYHLAIETPQPNLSAGMHWLQGTFAVRFNRFRKQNGRLFQGPYKALLLEDTDILCRVVDYIHLNPVRAGVVQPAKIGEYEWSSLRALKQGKKMRNPVLCASEWLARRGNWTDTPKGVTAYEKYLADLGCDEAAQKEAGMEGQTLSRGWVIGTQGWKQALIRECEQGSPLSGSGLDGDELAQIREARSENALAGALKRARKTEAQLQTRPRAQAWKLKMALALREEGVPLTWLSERLHLGRPSTVRSLLSKLRHS